MNKKTVINLICICFFLTNNSIMVFAQIQIPDSLRQYYNYIDSAEILIMDAKYVEAADYYQIAFSYKQKAFGIDIYNAAVCESKIPNYQNTYSYLKELIAKGYSIETLNKKKCFNDFFTSKYGKKLSKKAHSFKNEYNEIYRVKLDSLYYADQYYRHQRDSVKDKEKKQEIIRKIKLIDSTNFIYLEKLIKEYGFPSEHKIGLSQKSLSQLPHSVIFLHSHQGLSTNHFGIDFTNYINNAIEKGEIYPSKAFSLLFREKEIGLVNQSYSITKFILIPSSHYTINELNKMRLNNDSGLTITKWGYFPLDSINAKKAKEILSLYAMGNAQNTRKKILFNEKNKDFAFVEKYAGSKNIIWLNEEQYKNSIKNLIIIE